MAPVYAIYFIPELEDRKKISKLRSKMCKMCHTTQALQYPVHMSLASGTEIKKYKLFEEEIKEFCKKTKPFTINAEKNTSVLPDRFWTGISFKNSKKLSDFKNNVEYIKNRYSIKPVKMYFVPHITLAFPAKVDNIKPVKSPVSKFNLNRIAIVKKESKRAQYRLHKYIKLN